MLGTALDVASRAMALLWQGGPVMLVLIALSVIGLTIILAKIWQFFSRRVGRRKFIAPALRSWHEGDQNGAVAIVSQQRSPTAKVMFVAMQARAQMDPRDEALTDEIMRAARMQMGALDSGLRTLELIALLAPLCGIFGTVLAMIGVGAGAENPPVHVALVSTATGLAVSIVTVLFYYYLDARVERERRAMEAAVAAIVGANVTVRTGLGHELEEDDYEEEDDEEEEYYEPELR